MIVVVRNLRASGVNLVMDDYSAGLPSVMSFLGLTSYLAPLIGLPTERRWEIGVIPILHDVQVSIGRTRPEYQVGEGGVFKPSEMSENMIGSVDVSLILDLPQACEEHVVAKQLHRCRIAGGTIHNRDFRVDEAPADGSCLQRVHRGYAMIRAGTPDKTILAVGNGDDLLRLADVLFPLQREPGSGWFVPAALGHHLLEDPGSVPKRSGTRNSEVPHVFTEPVAGMAELVSVRNKRLREATGPGFKDLFWRWTAEGEWVLAHPTYHPSRNERTN